MSTIERGGFHPEYEVSMGTVFAGQDRRAAEIMGSNASFESKIEQIAEMQDGMRELLGLVEDVPSTEYIN